MATTVMDSLRKQIAAWWLGQMRGASLKQNACVDLWRLRPTSTTDLFTRASVLHFPARLQRKAWPEPRLPVSQQPGSRSPVALQKGLAGDFNGFAPYQLGDDPRDIDWRATARARQPIIRQWQGESQQPVVIVLDVSASLWFENGTSSPFRPIDTGLEMAVLVAASALARQMPVDLLLVSDRVELHLQHLQGRACIGPVLDQLASFQPIGRQTDWTTVAEQLSIIRPGAWLFWVSDFLWLPDPDGFNLDYRRFQSVGIKLPHAEQISHDENSIMVDIETGSRLTWGTRAPELAQAERLRRWSLQSRMPIYDLPPNINLPEIQLAEWLNRGLKPS